MCVLLNPFEVLWRLCVALFCAKLHFELSNSVPALKQDPLLLIFIGTQLFPLNYIVLNPFFLIIIVNKWFYCTIVFFNDFVILDNYDSLDFVPHNFKVLLITLLLSVIGKYFLFIVTNKRINLKTLFSKSKDYNLAPHTIYVACVHFIHKRRDLLFKVISEGQIFEKLFIAI